MSQNLFKQMQKSKTARHVHDYITKSMLNEDSLLKVASCAGKGKPRNLKAGAAKSKVLSPRTARELSPPE